MDNTININERLRGFWQYLLPQRFISACTYRLTRIKTPWLKNRLIRTFIAYFGVDMNEAAEPDINRYEHFNAFFTRALKQSARPVVSAQEQLCCPVDGAVSQIGEIKDDSLLQAKGQFYSLTRLLAGDTSRVAAFRGGSFATLYLSPRDYHRIHMPIDGRLQEMIHVPGKLFSVSPLTTRVVANLFARNERVIALFDTAVGPMAMVLVGAINVASIETVWAGQITPARVCTMQYWSYDEEIILRKGEEMGRFNMGSTVIILFAKHVIRWDKALQAQAAVRMGQCLAERRS